MLVVLASTCQLGSSSSSSRVLSLEKRGQLQPSPLRPSSTSTSDSTCQTASQPAKGLVKLAEQGAGPTAAELPVVDRWVARYLL